MNRSVLFVFFAFYVGMSEASQIVKCLSDFRERIYPLGLNPSEISDIVSTLQPIQPTSDRQKSVVVEVGGETGGISERALLFGELEKIPLSEDLHLFLLKDIFSRTHLIDPTLERVRFYDGSNLGSKEKKKMTRPSQVVINEKNLKERFCKKVPNFKNSDVEKKLDRLLEQVNMLKLHKQVLLNCGLSAATILTFDRVADDLFFDEARSNLYAKHRSNFNHGLIGMVIIHGCLSGLSPSQSQRMLYGGLSFYAIGNIYYELGLGQSLSNNKPVKTDYGDFTSGSAGILLYALYGRWLEKSLNINFRKFCK